MHTRGEGHGQTQEVSSTTEDSTAKIHAHPGPNWLCLYILQNIYNIKVGARRNGYCVPLYFPWCVSLSCCYSSLSNTLILEFSCGIFYASTLCFSMFLYIVFLCLLHVIYHIHHHLKFSFCFFIGHMFFYVFCFIMFTVFSFGLLSYH